MIGSRGVILKRGTVELRRLLEMESGDWAKFHRYFRDREIAGLNGASPIFLPLWLFKRVVIGEEKGGERLGFAIYVTGTFVGSVEFYDLEPPRSAVLGVLIGEKSLWGQGHGSLAIQLALEYLFTTEHFERVTLQTLEHNTRARRSFEKVGFRFTGVADAGKNRFAHYQISRSQWLALNNGANPLEQ
jgi:RimJ/RimL family protein N-acetyltransferase